MHTPSTKVGDINRLRGTSKLRHIRKHRHSTLVVSYDGCGGRSMAINHLIDSTDILGGGGFEGSINRVNAKIPPQVFP